MVVSGAERKQYFSDNKGMRRIFNRSEVLSDFKGSKVGLGDADFSQSRSMLA